MCTRTYLPFGSDGFLLTHSREENALLPTHSQDPQGWGNWIASGEHVGSEHLTASLLNGEPENSLRIIVLNSVNDPGATFGHDTNRVTRRHRDSHIQRFGLRNRRDTAQHRERGGRKPACPNRVVTLPL